MRHYGKSRQDNGTVDKTKCASCPYHSEDCDKVTAYEDKLRVRGVSKSRSSHTKRDTLCWCCSKVYSGCNWFRNGTPVEGWDATRRELEGNISYHVRRCPEFVRDISKLGEE